MKLEKFFLVNAFIPLFRSRLLIFNNDVDHILEAKLKMKIFKNANSFIKSTRRSPNLGPKSLRNQKVFVAPQIWDQSSTVKGMLQ